jgi:hypothetical protein
MAHPTLRLGQAYLGAYTDADGQWLGGGRDYRLIVPPDPPAKQFWSLCTYDALTHTLPDTPSKKAEISSRTNPAISPDGSVELRFGRSDPRPPSPPTGSRPFAAARGLPICASTPPPSRTSIAPGL